MTLIIAASGFLTAIVVLIIERTGARHDQKSAYKNGFYDGYRKAAAFPEETEKFLSGFKQPQQPKDK